MALGQAQKVVLLAQDAHDTGEWTERNLTPVFCRFQQRLRNWLAWRAALRRTLTPRRLLERELGLAQSRRLDLLLDEGYHQERDRRRARIPL
jgi:hypothetical protein